MKTDLSKLYLIRGKIPPHLNLFNFLCEILLGLYRAMYLNSNKNHRTAFLAYRQKRQIIYQTTKSSFRNRNRWILSKRTMIRTFMHGSVSAWFCKIWAQLILQSKIWTTWWLCCTYLNTIENLGSMKNAQIKINMSKLSKFKPLLHVNTHVFCNTSYSN